jgi:hypothetical protein
VPGTKSLQTSSKIELRGVILELQGYENWSKLTVWQVGPHFESPQPQLPHFLCHLIVLYLLSPASFDGRRERDTLRAPPNKKRKLYAAVLMLRCCCADFMVELELVLC